MPKVTLAQDRRTGRNHTPVTGSAWTAEDVVKAVRTAGLEGVIAKRKDSIYQSGERSSDWLKFKLEHQQGFVVGGYRPDD